MSKFVGHVARLALGACAAGSWLAPLIAAPASKPPAEVRLGVVGPLSGRAGEWGTRFLAGVQAAVVQANVEGSVPEGGRLSVESRDSKGRAAAAALATESLCEESHVAVIFPAPGHELSARAAAFAGRLRRVPVLGAGSLAETRRPPARLVFSLRVSLDEEVGELIRRAAAAAKGGVVTLIMPPESSPEGAEAARAVRRSAAAGGAKPPRLLSVDFGDVLSARQAGLNAAPGALVVVLPPAEAAAVVAGAGERGITVYSSTLCPPEWLARLAGPAARQVRCAVPLPSYQDERLPLARAYRAAMGSGAKLDYPSFEGFTAVRFYLEGLRRSGGDTSSEPFAASLETLDAEWEGIPVRFDSGQRQGLNRIWLVRISPEGTIRDATQDRP